MWSASGGNRQGLTRMILAGGNRQGLAPGIIMLAIGSALVFMTFMRYSLPAFGWVVFAPFLIFLHERGTLKQHLTLFGVLVVTFIATVSKMVTSEIGLAPVPMFAIPMALSYSVSLSIASVAHRRLGARVGVYTFSAMAVVMGWVQYSFTPGASRGGARAHAD